MKLCITKAARVEWSFVYSIQCSVRYKPFWVGRNCL